jgi:hypothetical protein
MEETYTSETSVLTRSTQCHIPEDVVLDIILIVHGVFPLQAISQACWIVGVERHGLLKCSIALQKAVVSVWQYLILSDTCGTVWNPSLVCVHITLLVTLTTEPNQQPITLQLEHVLCGVEPEENSRFSVVVKPLHYKPEGRGFETRWNEYF